MKTVLILLATVISYSAIGQYGDSTIDYEYITVPMTHIRPAPMPAIIEMPRITGHDHIWVQYHQDTVRSVQEKAEWDYYPLPWPLNSGVKNDVTVYTEGIDIVCLICHQKKKKIQATLYKKGHAGVKFEKSPMTIRAWCKKKYLIMVYDEYLKQNKTA